MPDDELTSSLAANIRLAASFHPSISHVCRRLGMNRPQFMKYAAGSSFPSRYNFRRICDFFGFEEHEMLLPPEQFSDLLRLRPRRESAGPAVPAFVEALLGSAQRQHAAIAKLHGYFYQYYYSFSTPGHILQSLVSIHPAGPFTAYKRLERLSRPHHAGPPDIYKYAGLILLIGDRIHMIDQETIARNELTQTILFPTYRNRVTLLTGLTIGVSGNDAHQPSAARVVLAYLGRSLNIRAAVAGCRLHPGDSQAVPPRVRDYLRGDGKLPATGVLQAGML